MHISGRFYRYQIAQILQQNLGPTSLIPMRSWRDRVHLAFWEIFEVCFSAVSNMVEGKPPMCKECTLNLKSVATWLCDIGNDA
jgi:hypothetical protein